MEIERALYMLPVPISDAPVENVLPQYNIEVMKSLRYFIVENLRTARRLLKRIDPSINISELTFYELNGHTPQHEISSYLNPLREGEPMGVMSEAGCPGIADPGASVVSIAQNEGFKVIPLIGPSSIILALMASGLNGQNFAFHGYLPVDNKERDRAIRELETQSWKRDTTQIFIETPYRNAKMMESLLQALNAETFLCVAADITAPEKQSIITKKVKDWKRQKWTLEKVPTIFLIYGKKKDII